MSRIAFGLLASATASLALAAETPASAPAPVLQRQELSLQLQASVTVAGTGTTVTFVGFKDQRCPTDVSCVWSGDAYVLLWVQPRQEAPQLVTVAWPARSSLAGQTSTAAGLQFCYLGLQPTRRLKDRIDPAQYVARLSVAAAGSGCKD